jgi:hypothetical protein
MKHSEPYSCDAIAELTARAAERAREVQVRVLDEAELEQASGGAVNLQLSKLQVPIIYGLIWRDDIAKSPLDIAQNVGPAGF